MPSHLPADATVDQSHALRSLITLEGADFARALREAVETGPAVRHPFFDALQTEKLGLPARALAQLSAVLLPLSTARIDMTPALVSRVVSLASRSELLAHFVTGPESARGCAPSPAGLRRILQSAPASAALSDSLFQTARKVAVDAGERSLRLARSDRPGCAFGAFAVLDWSWPPVAAGIRAALVKSGSVRASGLAPFEVQPSQSETLALLEKIISELAAESAHRRAILFGAGQALADRVAVWDALLACNR